MKSRLPRLFVLQILLAAVFFVCVVTVGAQAQNRDIWVDVATGSDSPPAGDGTIGKPLKTIGAAITMTEALNSLSSVNIYVRPGTYQGPIFFPWLQNVDLVSTDGPFVTTITGGDGGFNSLVVLRTEIPSLIQTIDGFTILDNAVRSGCEGYCAGGITVNWSTRGSIYNCIIRGNSSGSSSSAGGIEYNGDGGTIANNWIINNTSTSTFSGAGGLYVYWQSSVAIVNNTIAENVADTFSVAGVYLGGETAASRFDNNIVAINGPGVGVRAVIPLGRGADVAQFPIFLNNLHWGNGQNDALPSAVVWNGLVRSNPEFSGTDHHLSCTSPAIDKGLAPLISQTLHDIDGQTRPDLYPGHLKGDIGADEFYDDHKSVAYTASDHLPCPGDTVLFFNGSTICFDEGSTWDFGDGTTHEGSSLEDSVKHVYETGGSYTVSVTANGLYPANYTLPATVEVFPVTTPDFSADIEQGCAPERVTFTASGYDQGLAFFWDFGDGSPPAGSSQNTMQHTYTTPGMYNVQLILTDRCATDTIVKPAYITITEPLEADFVAADSAGCAPMTVMFTASANTNVDEFAWYFGTSQTPVMRPGDSDTVTHTFTTAGAQTVTLHATNACGTDTVTKADFITVNAEPFLSVSSSHDTISFTPCAPYTVEFDYFSDQDLTSFQWDFGDNSTSTQPTPVHVYQEGGKTYSVRLIAYSDCGADTAIRAQYITVQGMPTITPSASPLFVCAGQDAVTFSAQSSGTVDSTRWLFGNGASGLGTEHQYVYPAVGVFTPQLLVYHPCGADTLGITGESITVSATPAADFTATPDSGYEPQSVAFSDLTTNLPTSWDWSFGDGDLSTEADPTHIYSAGTFTVSLEVTNVCGTAIKTKTDHIRVGGFRPSIDSIGTSGDTILYSVLVDTLVMPYDQTVDLTAALTTTPRRGSMSFAFTVPSGLPPFSSTLKAVPTGGLASGDYVVAVTAADPLRISKVAARDLHFIGTRLLSITPVPVAVDSAIVGETISKFVKIKNDAAQGSGLFLAVNNPVKTGSAFTVQGNGGVLAPQGILTWAVVFTPPKKGPYTGTLWILSDDPASPDTTVPLSGRGIGEQTPPRVTLTHPDDGAETTFDDSLHLEFSEAMDQVLVDEPLTVRSKLGNADVSGFRRWRSNRRLDFVPVDGFRPDDTLTVLLRATVTDTNGNRLDGNADGIEQGPPADNYTFTFRTGPAVWPGDTDRDGKVNESDVIPIGRFWRLEGPARTDSRPGFVPQPAMTWNDPKATHADADGNGIIDSADVCPIIEFFDRQTSLSKSVVEEWMAEAQGWPNEIVSALRGALIECPGEGEGRLVLGRFLESLETPAASVPYDFSLAQNYPNPFNAATVIAYTLTEQAEVRLQVYDIQGRLVCLLDEGTRGAGPHHKVWDGRNSHGNEVASGVYFYRITAAGYRFARKMVLLR